MKQILLAAAMATLTVTALAGCEPESSSSAESENASAGNDSGGQGGTGNTDWLTARIESAADVRHWRSKLQEGIFGVTGIPNTMPDKVEAISDSAFDGNAIDRITMNAAGETSIAYLIHPHDPNGKLAIYHQGHLGDFRVIGADNIKKLLAEGYRVLALNMPRIGMNKNGTSSHDGVPLMKLHDGVPLRAFIEPVIISLNWSEANYAPTRTIMVGLSGGGWTTVVAAAADTRIDASFPVAGSWPCYLRETAAPGGSKGDYEQRQFCERPELPTYLELYILGSYERPQLQVFNYSDPCCFGGDHALQYEGFVQDRAGAFRVVIDHSHKRHAISDWAWEKIRAALHESDSK